MKRSYLNIFCSLINKKVFFHDLSVTPDGNPKIRLKHVDMIKNFTGCTRDKVIKAVSSKLDLQLLHENEVSYKLNLLEKLGLFDVKSLNILPLLTKHPTTLKNYFASLCEYGYTPYLICAFQLKRFSHYCRIPVSQLKKKGFIPKNADVLKTLWKHAELSISDCPEVSDNEHLHFLKAIALRAYFKEKIGVSDEEFNKQQQEINIRLLNKSFKNINENLRIFQEVIQLSNSRIFGNWYILYTDCDNTMAILNKVPTIGSTDMKVCLHVLPKIISMPVENMEKIIEYLKEAGISITALEKFPSLLTLNCENVRERLTELRNNEYLSLFRKHPYIVKLLHFQVKAKRRMSILQDLKTTCTMNYLISSEKEFERICEFGIRQSGIDSVYYVMAELNLKKDELVDRLSRHVRWRFVPVLEIAKNLRHLRKSFTDEEIVKNIYILFYYNERLLQEMEKLDYLEGMEQFKENGRFKKELILPLTIYFLEKDANFTGESIWETCTTNPYEDLPDDSNVKVKSV